MRHCYAVTTSKKACRSSIRNGVNKYKETSFCDQCSKITVARCCLTPVLLTVNDGIPWTGNLEGKQIISVTERSWIPDAGPGSGPWVGIPSGRRLLLILPPLLLAE